MDEMDKNYSTASPTIIQAEQNLTSNDTLKPNDSLENAVTIVTACTMLVGVIGICGNIIILNVFSRPGFAHSSTALLLKGLACFDLMSLLSGLAYYIIVLMRAKVCQIVYILGLLSLFTFWQCSNWTLVVVTMERVTAIVWPHKSKLIWTRPRCAIILVSIFLVVLAIDAIGSAFWSIDLVMTERIDINPLIGENSYKEGWAVHMISSAIPSIPLICGNIIIVRKLWLRRKKMRMMHSGTWKSKKAFILVRSGMTSSHPSVTSAKYKMTSLPSNLTLGQSHIASISSSMTSVQSDVDSTHSCVTISQSIGISEPLTMNSAPSDSECMEDSKSGSGTLTDTLEDAANQANRTRHPTQAVSRGVNKGKSHTSANVLQSEPNNTESPGRPSLPVRENAFSKRSGSAGSPINLILVFISLIFLLTNIPVNAYSCYSRVTIWPERYPNSNDVFIYYSLACLLTVNHSVNVLGYSFSGRRFRDEMKAMFRSWFQK